MNKVLKHLIEKNTPKFNEITMEGISRKILGNITQYLNNVIESAINTLDNNIDFNYKGFRFLTPEEDFKNNITSSYNKNEVDITQSYLYKVEFIFEYNGDEIRKIISLPFVERGGLIKMSNTIYAIVPVLSEYPVAPAPAKGEVFIRLLRDKLNVRKLERPILIDGERKIKEVIYANTFKLQLRDKSVNQNVPIILYPIIKHGLMGAFKHYFNTEPIITTNDELNPNEMAEKGYTEFTTIGRKPRKYRGVNYVPHRVKIYVKKEDVTPTLETFIAGLIYIFDLLPNQTLDLKRILGKKKKPSTEFDEFKLNDEDLFWIITLGYLIFGPNRFGLTRVIEDMVEHINILNGYLDEIIKEKLREMNIDVPDFYELLFWTLDNFDFMVMNYEKYSSNIDNRYIEILYYVLFDFIVSTNKAFLELKRTASKGKLSLKEANRIFTSYITPKKIFNLIKAGSMNIAVMPLSDYSGDNLYWKATSILEDQNKADGIKRSSKKNTLPANTRILRGEDIVFGSILNLKKKHPSPRFSLNPFVNVDVKTGKFVFDQYDRNFMSELETKLNTKFNEEEAKNIEILETEDIDMN